LTCEKDARRRRHVLLLSPLELQARTARPLRYGEHAAILH
jgi:hypothetical protein